MRCPDCSKMVSFDTEVEPEENNPFELAPDGSATGEWRRILNCAECGMELKEAILTLDEKVDVPESCVPKTEGGKDEEGEHEWDLMSVEVTAMERSQDKTPSGKPIRNPRYMKKFYGVQIDFTAVCVRCGADVGGALVVEEQASGFEEIA